MFRHVLAALTIWSLAVLPTQSPAQEKALTASPSPLTGLWWNASQSGWGITITQHGAMIFATWYSYDEGGKPMWYVMSTCPLVGNSCTSEVATAVGGFALTRQWNGALVTPTIKGTATLTFTSNNEGTLAYTINGASRSIPITRMPFGPVATPPALDYSDLWWNEAESGWGLGITQQYATIFATLYTYDNKNAGTWYVVDNCHITGTSCTGALTQASGGQTPTAAWSGANLKVDIVGSMTIDFSSAASATMRYTINGVSGTRSISRLQFGGEGLPATQFADVFDAMRGTMGLGARTRGIEATDATASTSQSCDYGTPFPTRSETEAAVRQGGGIIEVSTPNQWCGRVDIESNCLIKFGNTVALEERYGLDRRITLHMSGLLSNRMTIVEYDPTFRAGPLVAARTRDDNVTTATCGNSAPPSPKESINGNWIGYGVTYLPDSRMGSEHLASMSCSNQSCTILGADGATFALSSTTLWRTGAGATKLAGGALSHDLQLASMFMCKAPLDETRAFENCTFYSFKRM